MDLACIVYNPVARNAPSLQRLESAAKSVSAEGWQIEMCVTQGPEHGMELAREAAVRGASVVFSCGGDGTVNEVVNGLARSETALAVLRGGMGDVFGKEAGISRKPEQALRVLVEGERRRFDLGLAGRRYFLLMAGVGFDAGVVRDVPSGPKKHLGSTSYALWGALELAKYRSKGVILRINGQEREARLFWLLLGNTRSYGGIIDVTARARVDDGLLDAYLFDGRGAGWLASTALRLALRRHDGARGVSFHQVRELEVVSLGLPVQIDGEYIGETPMRFSVEPAALDVLLPRGSMSREFSG